MVEPITLRGFRKIEDIRFHFTIDKYCYVAFRVFQNYLNIITDLGTLKMKEQEKISDIKHPSIKAVFKNI